MSSPRPSLTEETLRDVKDDAIERLTRQQEKFGEVPSAARAEAWYAEQGIVEKIDRDHEAQRDKDLVAKAKPTPAPSALSDDVDVKVAGQYNFATGELVVTPEIAARLDRPPPEEGPNTRAAREIIRRIQTDPNLGEFKKWLDRVMYTRLPPGHHVTAAALSSLGSIGRATAALAPKHCEGCGAGARVCYVRETALRKILAAYVQKFGLPDLEPKPQGKAFSFAQRGRAKARARLLRRNPPRPQPAIAKL